VILLESIETGETFRVAVCKQFLDFLIAYGHFLDWNYGFFVVLRVKSVIPDGAR
jgi:hypothetical protein